MQNKKEFISGQLINNQVYICDEDPYIHPNGRKNRRIRIVCQFCGKSFIARLDKISSGHTKSCGCVKAQYNKILSIRKHGLSKTHIHNVWKGMKDRCYNKNSISYRWYGACGVTVCDEWMGSLAAFAGYVSELPNYGRVGYTLDRICTYGNYEPGNVKWSTWTEQSLNRKPKGTVTKK